MKELTKDKIKKSLLELRKNKKIIILILMVLIGVCYYFYERSFGYFVNVKINHILPEGRRITGLYKTGDFYTMIDDYNSIYAVNIDKNMRMSLIEKDIQKTLNMPTLKRSVYENTEWLKLIDYNVVHKQLDNGNIVFIFIDTEHNLSIYIYNPQSKIIIKNYKSNIKRYYKYIHIYKLKNGDFLLGTMPESNKTQNKKSYVERYVFAENDLHLLDDKGLFNFWNDEFELYDEFYLSLNKTSNSLIYNSVKDEFNEFSVQHVFEIPNTYLGVDNKFDSDIFQMKSTSFVFIFNEQYPKNLYVLSADFEPNLKSFRYVEKDIVVLKDSFSLNPISYYLSLDKFRLNEKEILFLGGVYGILIFPYPANKVFLYDVENKTFRKLKFPNLKSYYLTNSFVDFIPIDSMSFLFWGEQVVKIFKRSKVW